MCDSQPGEDREVGGDAATSNPNSATGQTGVVGRVVSQAVAAALVDTGCTEQYASILVEYGLGVVKEACKKILRPLA
jgi:hypothetical protein